MEQLQPDVSGFRKLLITDTPAKRDDLKRDAFVESVYPWLLTDEPHGLVVGLEGDWGSGKSTLLAMILQRLREEAAPIIVELNPWMVSGSDALVEFMLTQLAASIGQAQSDAVLRKGVRIGRQLLAYAAFLKELKYLKLVPGAGWLGELGQLVGDGAEDIAKDGKEGLDAAEKLLPKLDLARRKKELAAAIADLDRHIVVVIDDLDRLTDEEIRVTFQAIKAVADFPATTYLLAYDPVVVAKALHENHVAGAAYLDKIVQLVYPVPPLLRQQAKAFLDLRLRDVESGQGLQDRPHDARYMEEARQQVVALGCTPRQIIRLVNRYAVMATRLHGELNLADLLVLEAMAVRFPQFWRMLGENPQLFAGDEFPFPYVHVPGSINGQEGSEICRALEREMQARDVDARNASVVKACLCFLFPRLQEAYGISCDIPPRADLRVSSTDRFTVYLTRAMPELDERSSTYNNLLSDRGAFDRKLSELAAADISPFMNQLLTYMTGETANQAAEIRSEIRKHAGEWAKHKMLDAESCEMIGALFLALVRIDTQRRERLENWRRKWDVRPNGKTALASQVDSSDDTAKAAEARCENDLFVIEGLTVDEIIALPLAVSCSIVLHSVFIKQGEHESNARAVFEGAVQRALCEGWAAKFTNNFSMPSDQRGAQLRDMLHVWVSTTMEDLDGTRERARQWFLKAGGLECFLSIFDDDVTQVPLALLAAVIWDRDAFISLVEQRTESVYRWRSLFDHLRSAKMDEAFASAEANDRLSRMLT